MAQPSSAVSPIKTEISTIVFNPCGHSSSEKWTELPVSRFFAADGRIQIPHCLECKTPVVNFTRNFALDKVIASQAGATLGKSAEPTPVPAKEKQESSLSNEGSSIQAASFESEQAVIQNFKGSLGFEPEQCAICMEDLKGRVDVLSCGHSFDAKCITRWLNQTETCALCKKKVDWSVQNRTLEKAVNGVASPIIVGIPASDLPANAYGAAACREFLGVQDVGVEPPIPPEALALDPTKYDLFFLPTINGRPLTGRDIKEIAKNIPQVNKRIHKFRWCPDSFDSHILDSGWVAARKGLIPNSRRKTAQEQEGLLEPGFRMAQPAEIAFITVMREAMSKEQPLGEGSYTRAKKGDTYWVLGGLSASVLHIRGLPDRAVGSNGVAGLRKF